MIAIAYRVKHPEGSVVWTLDPNGNAINTVIAQDAKGQPIKDAAGNFTMEKTADGKDKPFTVTYAQDSAMPLVPDPADAKAPKIQQFQYHADAKSVVQPHAFSYVIIQACIAILILVGFESVTSMGEEAKNAKRDIPRAVILSLVIQGLFCYLIEYFAANYFLNNGYQVSNVLGSAAPIGDMMVIAGTWLFGSPAAGKAFMLVQAAHRVPGAHRHDARVPEHRRARHLRDGPRRGGAGALRHAARQEADAAPRHLDARRHLGRHRDRHDHLQLLRAGGAARHRSSTTTSGTASVSSSTTSPKIPQSLLVVTLVSNFGTFLLYMMTCIIAMVAFREHHTFNGFKHVVVPLFGLVANLLCMLFYLIGPFTVPGMSPREPFIALGCVAIWGIYGAIYFFSSSKKKGVSVYVTSKA